MKRIVALLVIFPMLIGCAEMTEVLKNNTVYKSFISFYDNLGLSDQTKIMIESAGAGAAIGALAGQIAGGDTESTVGGAAAGAVIGGVAGTWYANRVLTQQEELKGQENDLDARIEYATKVNSDAEIYNRNLKKELEDTKARMKKLKKDAQQNQCAKNKLKKEQERIAEKVKIAKKNEELLSLQLAELKEYRAKQKIESYELDEKIAGLENTLKSAKANAIALAAEA